MTDKLGGESNPNLNGAQALLLKPLLDQPPSFEERFYYGQNQRCLRVLPLRYSLHAEFLRQGAAYVPCVRWSARTSATVAFHQDIRSARRMAREKTSQKSSVGTRRKALNDGIFKFQGPRRKRFVGVRAIADDRAKSIKLRDPEVLLNLLAICRWTGLTTPFSVPPRRDQADVGRTGRGKPEPVESAEVCAGSFV